MFLSGIVEHLAVTNNSQASVTMLLGMRTIDLAARTAVPAIGLTVLISMYSFARDLLKFPLTRC